MIQHCYLHHADVFVHLQYPEGFKHYIDILFPYASGQSAKNTYIDFQVNRSSSGDYEIFENKKLLSDNLSAEQCALELMHEVIRSIAQSSHNYIAIHGAAVCNQGTAIVCPGNTGKGKNIVGSLVVYKRL